MAIRFGCVCGKVYRVDDDAAGKRTRCKVCGAEFRVPGVRRPADGSVFVPKTPAPSPPMAIPLPPPVARPSVISYPCPHCDTTLEVPGEHAGGEATCGFCNGRTIVPQRSKPQVHGGPHSPQAPIVSLSDVTNPLLVSAVSNLVYGVLLICILVGIPMLILSYHEFKLYKESDVLAPREFASRARFIGAFEVVSGLVNWFGLVCGILVLINAGKLERRIGAGK